MFPWLKQSQPESFKGEHQGLMLSDWELLHCWRVGDTGRWSWPRVRALDLGFTPGCGLTPTWRMVRNELSLHIG